MPFQITHLPRHVRRDCDPSRFTDPAELREEPSEVEVVDEYLIYGTFCRADRPSATGDFLLKRWCTLEHLVEHAGDDVKMKIDAYERRKVEQRDKMFDVMRRKRLRAERVERDGEEAGEEGERGSGEDGAGEHAEEAAAQ